MFCGSLEDLARPSLLPEGVGLLAGKAHDQVVLHQVVHGETLISEGGIGEGNMDEMRLSVQCHPRDDTVLRVS